LGILKVIFVSRDLFWDFIKIYKRTKTKKERNKDKKERKKERKGEKRKEKRKKS
jgi:hypothetical protein